MPFTFVTKVKPMLSQKLPAQWKTEFNTGVDFIDEQHRYFFDVVKKLEAFIESGVCEEKVSEVFFSLVHYVEKYTLQEEMNYKDLTSGSLQDHKKAHSRFVSGLIKFKDDYRTQHKQVCEELHGFLLNWFHDHILGQDKDMMEKLRNAGI